MEVSKYIKMIDGISYLEWTRLKTAVDRYFDAKKRESEAQLQLSDPEIIENLIRSQFGET